MNSMSGIRRDFIASHIRSQLNRLSTVLGCIEEETKGDCDYAHESLKEIENDLRKIRKLCANN